MGHDFYIILRFACSSEKQLLRKKYLILFIGDLNSVFNSFLCHLLITFANSLGPDQDRQNVGPDLDPNRLTR